MQITSLNLLNFKSYRQKTFGFESSIVAFTGPNGVGKTNLLDALHFLCMGRSYFQSNAKDCIQHHQNFLRLEGTIQLSDESIKSEVTVEREGKRKLKLNGKSLSKLSEMLGKFPVCMLCPDDQKLIDGFSDERRKFMDYLLSQTDKLYASDLKTYNRLLVQRNVELKNLKMGRGDLSLIKTYDDQMAPLATTISGQRQKLCEDILPHFQKFYAQISSQQEGVLLTYQSHCLSEDWRKLQASNLDKDRITGRSSIGIHKDDLLFEIEEAGLVFKRFASQGQKKTYLTALKLAQFTLLKERSGKEPLFLLDDIFDKLDQSRVTNLLELLSRQSAGQMFVSDTNRERVESLMRGVQRSSQIFEIDLSSGQEE